MVGHELTVSDLKKRFPHITKDCEFDVGDGWLHLILCLLRRIDTERETYKDLKLKSLFKMDDGLRIIVEGERSECFNHELYVYEDMSLYICDETGQTKDPLPL